MSGLYIHIPFCARRCGYCDFFSTTSGERRREYVRAAIAEMERERGFVGDGVLETIYFGGGTPSLLTVEQVGELLCAARRIWDRSRSGEVTLEANPDDLSQEYLAVLREAGVDRLSIGIQSFDDELLKFMGRRHDTAAAVVAVENARAKGFGNISIDLMYGIPGLDDEMWRGTLRRAVELKPEHISAYCLSVEPDTPFARQGVEPVDEAQATRQYEILRETLGSAGYEHYEISNFALPGRRSRHNSAYWNGAAYLGIGPSAHSYDGVDTRRWNEQTLEEYLVGPAYRSETLGADEQYNELIMTRLRTSNGIGEEEISARFGARGLQYFLRRAESFLSTGSLVHINKKYIISPAKWFVSDGIICSLFRE